MKLAKNAMTFLKEFNHCNSGEYIPTVNVSEHKLVMVHERDKVCGSIYQPAIPYAIGPIIDRLHEYEKLGYEPEELVEKLKKLARLEVLINFKNGSYIDTFVTDSSKHRFNRDEMAAIEAALKRDDKAVTFTRTDDDVMVTIAPWSKELYKND